MANEKAEMYERYKGIQFNRESVQQVMELYRSLHPKASEEELNNARDRSVIHQVVAATRARLMNLEAERDPSKKANLQNNISRMTGMVERGYYPENAFLLNCNKNELTGQLKQFQNTFGQMTSLEKYEKEVSGRFAFAEKAENKKAEKAIFASYGKAYIKSLFAPKPDGTDMLRTYADFVKEHSVSEGEQRITAMGEAQKAVNATEITVPPQWKGKEKLIGFAVMGELFTEERAKHVIENSNGNQNSYQADHASLRNSLQMLVITDLFKGDFRGDIPLTMQTVADCRNAVNEKLQSGSPDAIRDNLKNAFQTFLTDCMDNKDLRGAEWQYEAQSLKDILRMTEKTDFAFELTEQEKEKVKLISQKLELAEDTRIMEENAADIFADFVKSEGNDPLKDPVKNPVLFKKLLDIDICNTILDSMMAQSTGYIGDVVDYLPKNEKDAALRERPLTPVEKTYLTNIQGLEDDIKNSLLHGEKMKQILSAKTFDEKVKAIGTVVGLGTSEKPDIFNFTMDAEQKCAEGVLNRLKEKVGNLAQYAEQSQTMPDTYKQAVTKACRGVQEAIGITEQGREMQEDKSDLNNLKILAPLYKNIGEKMGELEQAVMGDDPLKVDMGLNNLFHASDVENSFCTDYSEKLEITQKNIAAREAQALRIEKAKKKSETTLTEHEIGDFITDFNTLYSGDNLEYEGVRIAAERLKDDFDAISDGSPEDGIYVSEDYRAFTEQAEELLKNHKDAPTQFVVGNFLQAIKAEKDIFMPEGAQKQPAPGEDFSAKTLLEQVDNTIAVKGTLAQRTFEARTSPKTTEDIKKEFKTMLDGLEKVSTRFGGNSKEFTQMFRDAKNFAKGPMSAQQLTLLAEKLEESSDAYINAKGRVPATEKGKARLALAHQLRNFCRENAPRLQQNASVMNDRESLAKNSTVKNKIDLRIKNCLDEMKRANTTRNKPLFAAKFAEMMCTKKVGMGLMKNEIDNEKAEQLLLPGNLNKMVKKVLPVAAAVFENKGKDALSEIMSGKDSVDTLSNLFNAQVKVTSAQKEHGVEEKVSGPVETI